MVLPERANRKRKKMQNNLPKHPYVLQHQKNNRVGSPSLRSAAEQQKRGSQLAAEQHNLGPNSLGEPGYGGGQLGPR